MHLVLKVISFQSASMGEDAEKTFDETGGSFGREPGKGNYWVLPDPERFVSGKHGEVVFRDGRYFIKDTSTNGLSVEGLAGAIGRNNSVQVSDGDVLLAGEFRLQAHLVEAASARAEVKPGSPTAQDFQPSGGAASLDPLDFVVSDTPSTDDGGAWPASQPDHSPVVHDHFQVPGVSNDPQIPEEEQPPIPAAEPPFEKEVADVESGELIPEDWDDTEFGLDSGEISKASVQIQPDIAGEPTIPPAVDAPGEVPGNAGVGTSSAPAPDPGLAPEPDFDRGREREPAPPAASAPGAPARQPSRQPAPGSAAPASESELYQAFLQGLGVADMANSQCSREDMQSYGALLRMMIGSLVELLSSRSQFKNEFRLIRTVLAPVENNPLKFSPNADEAMRIFFGSSSSGYLGLQESVDESLQDMKHHQVALIAGLQAVFQEFSSLMNPAHYTDNSAAGVKALLQSMNQKSRSWEQFCAECERLESKSASGIAGYFSDVFSNAYEERICMLNEIAGGRG